MKFSRGTSRTVSMFVVLGTVMVLLASTFVGVSGAGGGGGGGKPKADEIGITDDEIRIAVIADVENQLVPGLFQGSVDAVNAWAKGVNKDGGLAGRKVVVDFIDSHLSRRRCPHRDHQGVRERLRDGRRPGAVHEQRRRHGRLPQQGGCAGRPSRHARHRARAGAAVLAG